MCNLNHFPTIFTLIFLVGIISCGKKDDKANKENEISRIVFATGGCYGPCPFQAFSIDSTLTIKYHGVKHTKDNGFFVGKISNSLWDSINLKFESINYKNLDTSYEHSVDDLSTEIYIYYQSKIKHIHGQSMSLPDSVMAVYVWLMDIQKKLTLTVTSDSLIFETIIQKPLKRETIKFVPIPEN